MKELIKSKDRRQQQQLKKSFLLDKKNFMEGRHYIMEKIIKKTSVRH